MRNRIRHALAIAASVALVAGSATLPSGAAPPQVTTPPAQAAPPVREVRLGDTTALTPTGELGDFFGIRMADRSYVVPAQDFLSVTPATLPRYVVGPPGRTARATGGSGRWPMVTLTLRVTGMTGAPYDGIAAVLDADDGDKYFGVARVLAGRAKVSVPAGDHYVLMAAGQDGNRFALGMTPDRLVTEPAEISLDLRTATTPVRTVLPRPAVIGAQVTDLTRSVPTSSGNPLTMIFSVGTVTPAAVLVNPVRDSGRGEISVRRQEHHDSPAGARQRYAYDLTFTRPGSIPRTPLTFRADATNTATVVADYAGPASMPTGEVNRLVMAEGGGWALTTPVRRPGRIVHYESAGPQVHQGGSYVQHVTDEPPLVVGGFEGERTQLRPGTSRRETWGQWPLHQRLSARADRWSETPSCPSCLGAGQVVFRAAPLSDTDPSHIGLSDYEPPYPLPRWAIFADGAVLASGSDVAADPVAYPAGTRVLSTRVDARRTIGGRTSRTVTTWSVPVAASRPLPAGLACDLGTCEILPAITADYRLPLGLTGRLAAGARRGELTLGRVGGLALGAGAQVRLEIAYAGRPARPVPLTARGNGRFDVELAVPPGPAGAPVDLLLSVRTPDGSRLVERLTGAAWLAG